MNRTIFVTSTLVILSNLLMSLKYNEPKSNLVKIEKNLFVSETEVTNKDYREFLNYLLSTNQKEKYALCLYDSSKWGVATTEADALTAYYHRHVIYNSYPIVNITQNAMESYCEWLTMKYESSSDKKFKKVVYRLPTENEWKKIVTPLPANLSSSEKVIAYANVKSKSATSHTVDIPGPVNAYKPSKSGVYNTVGNVSEVTSEGKIVGGNFTTDIEECGIGKYQNYILPDARVGFRYVMEVIEF